MDEDGAEVDEDDDEEPSPEPEPPLEPLLLELPPPLEPEDARLSVR